MARSWLWSTFWWWWTSWFLVGIPCAVFTGGLRFASYSHLGPHSGLLVDPLPTGLPHRAPESVWSKFDPYTVDVYQTTSLLYAWTHVSLFISEPVCAAAAYPQEIVLEIPELLELLQDISYFNPKWSILMSVAFSRLQGIRTGIQHHEMLHMLSKLDGSMFPTIPMGHWSWLLDVISLGQCRAWLGLSVGLGLAQGSET